MTPTDLAALRETFLSAPIPWSTRIMAFWVSLSLFIVVLWLVRRRSLSEQYTPIWLVAATGLMILNIWPRPLFAMTRAFGAWSHASTLFYVGLLFLVALCLSYAVRLSALTLQVKNLAQEISLLRAQAEEQTEPTGEPQSTPLR
jgi:hypothetical protein